MKMYDYYKIAVESVVDLSTNDATSQIAKENAYLGIAKILNAYSELGYGNASVKVVALPDFTITRNKLRWSSGFSYGCIIFLDLNSPPLIPVGFRPNCCGVLLSKISAEPKDAVEVLRALKSAIRNYDKIDADDFNRRNHFLSVLRHGDDVFVLLHGSFRHVKNDNNENPGLYIERSKYWQKAVVNLKFGSQTNSYLFEDKAEMYFNLFLKYELLSRNMRESIVLDIFPEAEVVFHKTHEGFYDIRTLLLGAYAQSSEFSFPLMISPEMHMPVVTSLKPLSILSPNKDLSDLFVAPHGAGYMINDAISGNITYLDSEEIYVLKFRNEASMYFGDIQNSLLSYRKDTDEFWCNRLFAGNKLFDMQPIFFTKI